MQLVIIESPYRGDTERNERYARRAMHDAFQRGEAPYASHLLYTQPGVLDDTIAEERNLGIRAGFAWRLSGTKTVVYQDYGISDGMIEGIRHAISIGSAVEYRTIGKNP